MYVRLILSGLLVNLIGWLGAQNLVPNPSFEELDRCPDTLSHVSFAPPWQALTPANTPNIWHPCDQWGFYSTPNYTTVNYLEAQDGVGYAGVIAYSNNTDITHREYIQTELLETMIADKSYYVEYYISPYMFYGLDDFSFSNTLGLAISNTPFESVQMGTPSETGVIAEYLGDILDEPIWTRVQGCYVANGGEKNIIIGEFRREHDIMVNTSFDNNGIVHTYFFIDNVGIYLFDPVPDTVLICPGETLTYDASFRDASYQWNTGEQSPNLNITSSGYYEITAQMGSCDLIDGVYVIDPTAWPGLPNQTEFCEGELDTLSAPPGFDNYQWSTGAQGTSILVSQAGSYTLTVSNSCDTYIHSTEVVLNNCDCNIYVPNAFSPNADGVNDELRIFPGCDLPYAIKSLRVFDRWGGLVHEQLDNNNPAWNGRRQGKPLPNGVYIWVLDYQYERGGELIVEQLSGDLTLLR